VALAILAMGLGVLLTAQASSLDAAGRARDLTVATLLARGKMIDIEQELIDEGFPQGEQTDDGEFGDEGHPEIKWASKVSEIELDLGGLGSLCAGFGEGEGDSTDCESMLGSFGGMAEGFMSDLGNSVRVVELKITWPTGPKYTESFSVKTMAIREDFNFGPATPFEQTGGGLNNSYRPPVFNPTPTRRERGRGK